MPWSIFLSSYGLIIGYTATIVIGAVMAWYEGSNVDFGLTGFVLTMNSIPYYVVAIVMLVVLGFQYHIFPTGGRYAGAVVPGFNVPFMVSVARHAAMPIISTVVVGFAAGSLQLRGNAIRVIGSAFIRSARIRGIGTNRILTRYLTRNAILPTYTSMMVDISSLFSSSVIVECIFQYVGVGWYMFEALRLQDYPLVMGSFMFFATITVMAILFADLTYGLIDPRARHEVRFDVSGAGELAGVDNGNLDGDESWVGDARSAYHGTCTAVVRADRDGGTVTVEASADGLAGDSVTVDVGEEP